MVLFLNLLPLLVVALSLVYTYKILRRMSRLSVEERKKAWPKPLIEFLVVQTIAIGVILLMQMVSAHYRIVQPVYGMPIQEQVIAEPAPELKDSLKKPSMDEAEREKHFNSLFEDVNRVTAPKK